MKLKFPYLYISFIVSLAILVILSFLFHKRLNSHLRYTSQFKDSYTIIMELKDLGQHLAMLESHSRAFLLSKDSSFLPLFEAERDSVYTHIDSLKTLIADNSDQMRRFLLMRSIINSQVSMYSRSISLVDMEDPEALNVIIQRSNSLMKAFNDESLQIQRAELHQRDEMLKTKEFYEDFYPNFFNTISIWAGVVTLISFFFIHREVRMRTRYQAELEKRLQELNRSNSELRQFAYIASHDLQEPLRKIRTFSDKLVYKHQHEIDSETKAVLGKIESSAQRMQELIHDMLNFTSLVTKDDEKSEVDLNKVVTDVLEEFADQSRQMHAVIKWDTLPEINGNQDQLYLLFKSLFDNAFKFAKPGESPVIKISYKLVEGNSDEDDVPKGKNYHRIVMEDKGIGFNNEFAEKIFMIFQRLHTQQSGYRGKGIGLAIAQRIVTNHSGIIMARGMINDGATFIMYFPA
ncbi:MAG: CHASE3 domain-containing protein [Chitinophagaceae bacterium]|nr:CHASE3 domain-containing protein [Chitinophagaceae bacterium]